MTYYAPVDLGGIETVPLQATTSQRSQLWDEHIKDLLIHDNNHNMDAGLRTMVLEAVNNTYIFALHKVFMVYMGSSTKYIMNHLMTLYGHITAADIKWRKIPSRTLRYVTTYWCVLQYHQWRSTIRQKGKHTVHVVTISTNGIPCCKIFCNILILLQTLTLEAERGKDIGEFQKKSLEYK